MKTVTLRLSDEDHEALSKKAAANGWSLSELLRRAANDWEPGGGLQLAARVRTLEDRLAQVVLANRSMVTGAREVTKRLDRLEKRVEAPQTEADRSWASADELLPDAVDPAGP